MKTPKVRGLRTIKKDILKLINTYIECAIDLDTINRNMIDPFFEVVLVDYQNNVDIARDHEVLNVIATMVNKLGVIVFQLFLIMKKYVSNSLLFLASDEASYFFSTSSYV